MRIVQEERAVVICDVCSKREVSSPGVSVEDFVTLLKEENKWGNVSSFTYGHNLTDRCPTCMEDLKCNMLLRKHTQWGFGR